MLTFVAQRNTNLALSKRRAALVRDYLVSKGVPESDIEVRGEGKDNQLDEKTVAVLESQSKERPEGWMTQSKKTTWLAYNRRTDLGVERAASTRHPSEQVSSVCSSSPGRAGRARSPGNASMLCVYTPAEEYLSEKPLRPAFGTKSCSFETAFQLQVTNSFASGPG